MVPVPSGSAPAGYGPRERVLQLGEARLSDAECLALILRTGRAGASAEQIGQRLLAAAGGLARLARSEVRELAACAGVGPVRAAALAAAFGLARRLHEARLRPGVPVTGGGDVARVVRESSRAAGRETFWALLLDARHRVLALRIVSTGTLQSAPVHPREVFRPAIREGASALVVAHNHPSGDATPSADDRETTARLRGVGELVGIELLDHVVVGESRYFSFADGSFHPLP